MKTLSTLFNRLTQSLIVVGMCAFMLIGVTSPALAFGSTPSDSSKGVAEMGEITETAEQTARKGPRNAKEIQEKAKRGPNGVQGDAGLEKMNTPANSQQARTVVDQAEDMLESATPDR